MIEKKFSRWETEIGEQYNIDPKIVEAIWTIGRDGLKGVRPKSDIARIYLNDKGILTPKGQELYEKAEILRCKMITGQFENIKNGFDK